MPRHHEVKLRPRGGEERGLDASGSSTRTCTVRAVSRRDEVILLQPTIEPGSSGDPVARGEVTRIAAPPGAKLELFGS